MHTNKFNEKEKKDLVIEIIDDGIKSLVGSERALRDGIAFDNNIYEAKLREIRHSKEIKKSFESYYEKETRIVHKKVKEFAKRFKASLIEHIEGETKEGKVLAHACRVYSFFRPITYPLIKNTFNTLVEKAKDDENKLDWYPKKEKVKKAINDEIKRLNNIFKSGGPILKVDEKLFKESVDNIEAKMDEEYKDEITKEEKHTILSKIKNKIKEKITEDIEKKLTKSCLGLIDEVDKAIMLGVKRKKLKKYKNRILVIKNLGKKVDFNIPKSIIMADENIENANTELAKWKKEIEKNKEKIEEIKSERGYDYENKLKNLLEKNRKDDEKVKKIEEILLKIENKKEKILEKDAENTVYFRNDIVRIYEWINRDLIKANENYKKEIDGKIKEIKSSSGTYIRYKLEEKYLTKKVVNLLDSTAKLYKEGGPREEILSLKEKFIKELEADKEKALKVLKIIAEKHLQGGVFVSETIEQKRNNLISLHEDFYGLDNKYKNQKLINKIKKLERKKSQGIIDFNELNKLKNNLDVLRKQRNITKFTEEVSKYAEHLGQISEQLNNSVKKYKVAEGQKKDAIKRINKGLRYVVRKYNYYKPCSTKEKIKRRLDDLLVPVLKTVFKYQKFRKTKIMKLIRGEVKHIGKDLFGATELSKVPDNLKKPIVKTVLFNILGKTALDYFDNRYDKFKSKLKKEAQIILDTASKENLFDSIKKMHKNIGKSIDKLDGLIKKRDEKYKMAKAKKDRRRSVLSKNKGFRKAMPGKKLDFLNIMFEEYKEGMNFTINSLKEELPKGAPSQLKEISSKIEDLQTELNKYKDFEIFRKNSSDFVEKIKEIDTYVYNNRIKLTQLSDYEFVKGINAWANFAARTSSFTYYVNLQEQDHNLKLSFLAFKHFFKKRVEVKIEKLKNTLNKVKKLPENIRIKVKEKIKKAIEKEVEKIELLNDRHYKKRILKFLQSEKFAKFCKTTKKIEKSFINLFSGISDVLTHAAKKVVPNLGEQIGDMGARALGHLIPVPVVREIVTPIFGTVGGIIGKRLGEKSAKLIKDPSHLVSKEKRKDAKIEQKRWKEKLTQKISDKLFPIKQKLKDVEDPVKELREHMLATISIRHNEAFEKIRAGEINIQLKKIENSLSNLPRELPSNINGVKEFNDILMKLKNAKNEEEKYTHVEELLNVYHIISKSKNVNKLLLISPKLNKRFARLNNAVILTNEFNKGEKLLKSENPVDFIKGVNCMSKAFDDFNEDYIESKFKKNKSHCLGDHFSDEEKEEIRQTMILTSNAFYEATIKFQNDPRVKKLIENKKLPKNTNLVIKKLELNVLKVVTGINYVLVPIMKYALPIGLGIAGSVVGGSLGASLDTAASGVTLGSLSLVGSIVGGALGSAIGKALSGGYGWLNKRFKERLSLLQKELAVEAAYDYAIKARNQYEMRFKPELYDDVMQPKENLRFTKELEKKTLISELSPQEENDDDPKLKEEKRKSLLMQLFKKKKPN